MSYHASLNERAKKIPASVLCYIEKEEIDEDLLRGAEMRADYYVSRNG